MQSCVRLPLGLCWHPLHTVPPHSLGLALTGSQPHNIYIFDFNFYVSITSNTTFFPYQNPPLTKQKGSWSLFLLKASQIHFKMGRGLQQPKGWFFPFFFFPSKGWIVNNWKRGKNHLRLYTATSSCIAVNANLWLARWRDHTFNNLKQKVNGVITTIIPFKIIILLFFMSILPSPFPEPTLPAVSLCHKVCWTSS